MKASTKVDANQGKVWDSVAEEQVKLSAAMHTPVAAAASPSSYQLTLEHERIQERIKGGLEKLRPLLREHHDAVGFAFAIRGELSSAESYVSHDLFAQLWDKLLTAAVTEAAAEHAVPRPKEMKDPTAKDVEAFLTNSKDELAQETSITPRVLFRQYRSKNKAGFETADLERGSVCVHTSVLSS
jgi:hypothetical protein